MNNVVIRALRIVLPIGVLAGSMFVAVTLVLNRPPAPTVTPVFEAPGVRAYEVAFENVPLTVISQGTVRPRTESQLVPEVAGRILSVSPSFAEGGFFEAGDVLVEIDPFDYQQAVIGARSQLAQARLRLAQEEAEAEVATREWQDLGRGDPQELTLRKPQLEEARASVAAADANVDRAERDLERAKIVAPYAGRIRRKNVDVGQFVSSGTAVATIYSVDSAEVRLPLPDGELAYLDLPLSYRGGEQQPTPAVTLRATFAGQTHEWLGRIVRTESEIDPVSRMVHVVAQVEDPYAPGPSPNRPPLAVGMYVDAEIQGRIATNIAVLPRSALRGSNQVLVINPDDRIFFRDIDILRATTDSVFVRGGLESGELVATSPLDAPTDGMRVQIANTDPELTARRSEQVTSTSRPNDERSGTTVELQDIPPIPNEPTTATPVDLLTNAEPARPSWLEEFVSANTESAPNNQPIRRASNAPPTPSVVRPETDSSRANALATTTDIQAQRSQPEIVSPPPPNLRSVPREAVARPSRPAEGLPLEPATSGLPKAPVAIGEKIGGESSSDTVIVLPFLDLNPAADNSELGAVLANAVADALANNVSMTVGSSQDDARFIVGGGLQQLGSTVRVTARIVDTTTRTVLHAVKVDGEIEDIAGLRTALVDVIAPNLNRLGTASSGSREQETPRENLTRQQIATNPLIVLPFDNLGTFGEGPSAINLGQAITDSVTTQLKNLPVVTVVLPNEAATFAVEGGVQRISDIIRVTARLIETSTGNVLTAIKIDGTLTELNELQDRVASALSHGVEDAVTRDVDIGTHGTNIETGRRS